MPTTDQLGRQPADHQAILETLVAEGVLFLVAGGMAVQAHGYVRMTLDVDIIPRPDQRNMARLATALERMEAAAVDDRGTRLPLDLSHPESLAVGNYFLTTRFGALDLFNGPHRDLKRYSRLKEAAIEVKLPTVTFWVVGKEDLIAMKRVAGREKDLADIAALTEPERGR